MTYYEPPLKGKITNKTTGEFLTGTVAETYYGGLYFKPTGHGDGDFYIKDSEWDWEEIFELPTALNAIIAIGSVRFWRTGTQEWVGMYGTHFDNTEMQNMTNASHTKSAKVIYKGDEA